MYEDKSCAYCGEQFAKNDDIVVCPDCGAPYHRACWDKHGECAHKAEHGSGQTAGRQAEEALPSQQEEDFVAAVQAEIAQDKREQARDTAQSSAAYCEACGAKMVEGSEYCVYCSHKQGDPVTGRNQKYRQADPLGGMAPEETIAGESVADMALVVRNRSGVILPKLKKLSEKKLKIGWSWPAFLFGYLYFFFRKMYKYGLIIIMAQVLLLNVFNFALGDPVNKTNNILLAQYNTIVKTDEPTQEEYYKVVEATALEMNESGVTKQLYIILAGSILAVHLACALLFEWLYMKHCGNTIARIRKSAEILGGMSKSDFRLNLLARGGVSIFGIFIGYFAKMAVEQFVALLMSMFGG